MFTMVALSKVELVLTVMWAKKSQPVPCERYGLNAAWQKAMRRQQVCHAAHLRGGS
jgi:hypothetical protein